MAGIVDTLTGAGNRKLQGKADAANTKANAITDRIVALYDEYIKGVRDQSGSGGLYDAESQVRLADETSARAQEIDSASIASNAAILGYQKGDSAPMDAIRASNQDYELKRKAQRFGIRQGVQQAKLGAMNPSNASPLMGPAGLLTQQSQNYLSQMTDPSQFYSSLIGYQSAKAKK